MLQMAKTIAVRAGHLTLLRWATSVARMEGWVREDWGHEENSWMDSLGGSCSCWG
jgi:hypothetical protein